jgi:hypothetical protein
MQCAACVQAMGSTQRTDRVMHCSGHNCTARKAGVCVNAGAWRATWAYCGQPRRTTDMMQRYQADQRGRVW